MFCPRCGSEYRAGIAHCAECEVDLVEELPEDHDEPELVAILATTDQALLATIRHALENARIPFTVGSVETASQSGDKVSLFVKPAFAQAALSLLAALERPDSSLSMKGERQNNGLAAGDSAMSATGKSLFPWSRFWARHIDMMIATILFWLVMFVGAVFAVLGLGRMAVNVSPVVQLGVFYFGTFLFWAIVEAAFVSCFGTTPPSVPT